LADLPSKGLYAPCTSDALQRFVSGGNAGSLVEMFETRVVF
jgi:hypothetical protein